MYMHVNDGVTVSFDSAGVREVWSWVPGLGRQQRGRLSLFLLMRRPVAVSCGSTIAAWSVVECVMPFVPELRVLLCEVWRAGVCLKSRLVFTRSDLINTVASAR